MMVGLQSPSLGQPLSFGEELYWRAEREGGAAPTFVECPRHLYIALRVSNALDVSALSRALQRIVERHDTLRSVFGLHIDRPMRMVMPSVDMSLAVTELGLPEADSERCVARTLSDEVRQPFALTSGQAMRTKLLRLGEQEHVFVLVVHHIAFDGWSESVFLRELKSLYGSYAAGADGDAGLPPLAVRYADYVHRQRTALDTSETRASLACWQQYLRGASPLYLSASARSMPDISDRSVRAPIVFDHVQTTALQRLSQRGGVTLAVTLAALFKLFLHKLTGANDVLVGMPIADRARGRFDDIIGLFLNLVMLRTDFSGDPDFATVLQRVQAAFRVGYQHGEVPYGLLLNTVPEATGHLVRVVFNFVNLRGIAAELPGLRVQKLAIDGYSPSLADLSLHVGNVGGTLEGWVTGKAELFQEEHLQQMIRQLKALVAQVLAGCNKRLREYVLAS